MGAHPQLTRPQGGWVILAHTPPPLHGQSLMVALMLEALRVPESGEAPMPPIFPPGS